MPTKKKTTNTQNNIAFNIGIPILCGVLAAVILLSLSSLVISKIDSPKALILPLGYFICIATGLVIGAMSSAMTKDITTALINSLIFSALLVLISSIFGYLKIDIFAGIKILCCFLACIFGAAIQIKLSVSHKRKKALR